MTFPQLLLSLVCILATAKLGGELAVRLGQPSVLGELVGGIAIGASGLRLIDPHAEVLHLLAELGVLVLLFEIGLETKLRDLKAAGMRAFAVALAGMAAPFLLGGGLAYAFGFGLLPSILLGAALTATSIGISARVLSDQGVLRTATGSLILGAAILDDVLGVSLLAIISRIAELGSITPLQVLETAGSATAFVVVTLLVGTRVTSALMDVIGYLRSRGILVVSFTTFAFLLAYLASALGSAPLIGAFAAGLLLEDTERKHELEARLKPVTDLLAPIFFVSVGASLNLASLDPSAPAARPLLAFTALLVVVAVVGKLVAGLVSWRAPVNRLAVGVGMLPRGEVGLIFAGVGEASGLLAPGLYAALVITIAATTLMAPPWLMALAPSIQASEAAARANDAGTGA